MLPEVGTSPRRFSWRAVSMLVLLAAAALALPAVYVIRVASAAADDSQTGDKQASDKPKTNDALVEFLPRPSAAEKNILAALEQPTECDFDQLPLADVLDYFNSKHAIEIQIDSKALQENAIDESVPVTRHLKNVSLKSALRRILAELGITFVIRDEVLLITNKDEAAAWLVTRTYPVGDLVAAAQDEASFKSLLEAIATTVDATSWNAEGGAGSAKIVAPVKSLVISQSYGTHEKILDLLRSLRAAKAKQEAGDKSDAVKR